MSEQNAETESTTAVTETATSGSIGQVSPTTIEDQDSTDHENPTVEYPIGGRPAFARLGRALTDEELANPGTPKMLVGMLEELDLDIEDLEQYKEKYFIADKQVGILNEKLLPIKRIEIFFGVGLAIGGIIIGIIPYTYSIEPLFGLITGVVGIVIMIGSIVGRVKK